MGILKSIAIWILIINVLFGAKVTMEKWKRGETFSQYIHRHNVPLDIFKSISSEDLKFLSEIRGDQEYYELRDPIGNLEQILIPIGIEMQIRVAKERKTNHYTFDIIPIVYKQDEYYASVMIESNPYIDIRKSLNHPALADKMGQLLKGTIDTRKLKKGDKISFVYEQKTRMGRPYYMPHIKIAMLESQGKKQFIYADEDGYGYTSDKKSQAYTVRGRKKITYTRRVARKSRSSRFGMPLRHIRVTSSFSRRRWHPILKRYRPHHGTDFGARKGTPLLAVNDGRVSFSGWMRGYGNVVKIRHAGGYESLYAHQSRRRVKRGQRVKKGQIIGYVGSTGRSTGPHLHFGLTKNGRWVDPMKVLRRKSAGGTILKKFTKYKETTTTKYKKVVIKNAKENKAKLLAYLKHSNKPFIWDDFTQTSMRINDE
ncbi:Membrane proteins related to metalloendopeptidases [hydrothermal vent metagenome]|uniref:Membrane proteins related to metalloendopeptidases n=1 Tax=hydrothermal vent metagenome TaxID=652676 RepID=A0A1W1CL62_9ZZZZ